MDLFPCYTRKFLRIDFVLLIRTLQSKTTEYKILLKKKIILKEGCQKVLEKINFQHFCHKFSFLNRFTQTPILLLPKFTKHNQSFFCQCSLTAACKFTNGLFQKKSKQWGCRHGIFRGTEKIECGNSRS